MAHLEPLEVLVQEELQEHLEYLDPLEPQEHPEALVPEEPQERLVLMVARVILEHPERTQSPQLVGLSEPAQVLHPEKYT